MLQAWRLTTAKFAATAFNGEGACRYGGRWNPKGIPMVYTAGSLSLALLELMVQDQPLRARYVAFCCKIPDDAAVARIDAGRLPPDWRRASGIEACQKLGAEWFSSARTALLAVPSAVIPHETNYLLNPTHPDFARVAIGAMQAIETDSRLLARRASHETR